MKFTNSYIHTYIHTYIFACSLDLWSLQIHPYTHLCLLIWHLTFSWSPQIHAYTHIFACSLETRWNNKPIKEIMMTSFFFFLPRVSYRQTLLLEDIIHQAKYYITNLHRPTQKAHTNTHTHSFTLSLPSHTHTHNTNIRKRRSCQAVRWMLLLGVNICPNGTPFHQIFGSMWLKTTWLLSSPLLSPPPLSPFPLFPGKSSVLVGKVGRKRCVLTQVL